MTDETGCICSDDQRQGRCHGINCPAYRTDDDDRYLPPDWHWPNVRVAPSPETPGRPDATISLDTVYALASELCPDVRVTTGGIPCEGHLVRARELIDGIVVTERGKWFSRNETITRAPSPETPGPLITIRRAQGEAIESILDKAARGVVLGPTGQGLAADMADKVRAALTRPSPETPGLDGIISFAVEATAEEIGEFQRLWDKLGARYEPTR